MRAPADKRQLEQDARELVWRVLERFDQIPTPQQVDQATRQIVAAFAFLRLSDGALGRQDVAVQSNGTTQNPSTPPTSSSVGNKNKPMTSPNVTTGRKAG